jgi:hypothetical protein
MQGAKRKTSDKKEATLKC